MLESPRSPLATPAHRLFVRWTVLNWNYPAVELYKSLGANFLDQWRTVVLTGEELRRLAAKNT
jgi:hypothetical protein